MVPYSVPCDLCLNYGSRMYTEMWCVVVNDVPNMLYACVLEKDERL